MQVLSESESKFIDRRSHLIRIWPYVGAASLVVIAFLTGYLLLVNPLLINPFYVMAQIETNSIPESTLLLMAGIAPIVVALLLLVMMVMTLYVFAALSNERKLIAVVNRLSK